jgi:hypothetical protein
MAVKTQKKKRQGMNLKLWWLSIDAKKLADQAADRTATAWGMSVRLEDPHIELLTAINYSLLLTKRIQKTLDDMDRS